MTDMTPEEINRRIAEWAGVKLESDCHLADDCVPGGDCDICTNNKPIYPDYYGSSASQDLLKTLVAKNYVPSVEYLEHMQEWEVAICRVGDNETVLVVVRRAELPEAICHAICELAEREGKCLTGMTCA